MERGGGREGPTHHCHGGLGLVVVVENLLPVPQMNTDLEERQRGISLPTSSVSQ